MTDEERIVAIDKALADLEKALAMNRSVRSGPTTVADILRLDSDLADLRAERPRLQLVRSILSVAAARVQELPAPNVGALAAAGKEVDKAIEAKVTVSAALDFAGLALTKAKAALAG
ncbi:MAG: hypothetical protein ABIZ80_22820 [Bryobacteraceae bacterium]